MQTYVSLLRGVNVSGHNMIAMPKLRDLYESLGLTSVTTYIQSGNVVFRASENDPESARSRIERALERSVGFPITVILRRATDLQRIIRSSPFSSNGRVGPEHLYVTFLETRPAPALAKGLAPLTVRTKDEYRIAGKEIFLHCPDGYGRTLLSNTFFEKHLKVRATTRNWKTVYALAAMMQAGSD